MRKALIPPLILIAVLVLLSSSMSLISVASGDPDPSPKGMIFSSDASGNKKDDFLPTEDVYVYGVGLVKNAKYTLSIIYDTTMKDGDPIPPPATGTTTTDITTDGNGSFGPAKIWSALLTPGYYDIIADCQDKGNVGYFDREWDAEDTIEASDKYGFFVIPEIPLGALGATTALFSGLGITAFYRKKRD